MRWLPSQPHLAAYLYNTANGSATDKIQKKLFHRAIPPPDRDMIGETVFFRKRGLRRDF